MAHGDNRKELFDSASELLADIDSGRKELRWMESGADRWNHTAKDARGDEPASAVMRRLLTEGWQDGASLVAEMAVDLIDVMPRVIRRRPRWTDAGDEIEMQRVYNGDLDHAWRRTVRASGRGPQRVQIAVDCIATGGTNAKSMLFRGAAAVALADGLTAAGYSVQIVSAFRGDNARLGVITKSYTAPVDIQSLAATTVHPGFFRILGHAWGERHGLIGMGGYTVHSLTPADLAELMPDESAHTFIAPQSLRSIDDCKSWLTECIGNLESEDD